MHRDRSENSYYLWERTEGNFLENVCSELCDGYRGIYISKNSMSCEFKIYVFFWYVNYTSIKKKEKEKIVWSCPWKHNVCMGYFYVFIQSI